MVLSDFRAVGEAALATDWITEAGTRRIPRVCLEIPASPASPMYQKVMGKAGTFNLIQPDLTGDPSESFNH